MGVREKMRARCELLLPGERVCHVVYAQVGPSPWFLLLSWLVVLVLSQYRIIAVTTTSIVVFKAGMWGATPKEVLAVFPRHIRLGPVKGLWAAIHLGDERYWVHKRFHKDVEAADAEIGVGAPLPAGHSVPAGWYADPYGQARLRWWDGTRWTEEAAP